MRKSAMVRAFQLLADKPMVLLLIVPVQALSALSIKFMPDLSGLLNPNNFMNPATAPDSTFMLSYMVYLFISSIIGLVGLAAAFLLTPPAMELYADGAAERATEEGWYMRGLRKHWWKPIVSRLVMSVPIAVVAIGVYIVTLLLSFLLVPMFSLGYSGLGGPSSGAEGGALVMGIAFGLLVAGAIILASLAIQSFFALFLPALVDRSFGEAFKLLFSRKGLRKFFKAFGGFLILTVIPLVIIALLGGLYIVLNGVPDGPLGIVAAMLGFLRSWTGVLGMFLASLTGVLIYAFEFSLYQQVKEEEGQQS